MKKILIVNLGRKGAGPVYSLEMTKALLKLGKFQVKALISRQCENYEAWVKSGIQLITIDTFESNKEFILNTFKIHNFIRLNKELKKFDGTIRDKGIGIYLAREYYLPVAMLSCIFSSILLA